MSQPMKFYGIVPPTGKYIREDRCQTPIKNLKTIALRPPVDLLYAAAAFEKAGCDCKVLDYPAEDRTPEQLESDLREMRPDFLLMSITTPSLEDDMRIAALAKRAAPGIKVAAKGAHFNTLDRESMEKCADLDYVLRGEYEHTCSELGQGKHPSEILGLTWRNEAGEVVQNPARPFADDLDAIAFPARHLANNALYRRPDTGELQTTIITNRGCPFHCIYCLANQVAGTKNRYRSVENVIAEITECVEKHGIRNFLFRSDLFTQNKKWVIRLCQAILEAKLDIEWACNSRVDTINEEALGWMKKAGCWIIAFGVESGDQKMLDLIDKGAKAEDAMKAIGMVRAAGIKSSAYLLMGLPWDTKETIEAQIAFGRKLDPDVLEYFYAYPFPGTPLYDICVKEGLIKAGEIPHEAYDNPAMPGLYLSVEEFSRLRRRAMRSFYLRPSKIFKTLQGVRSPGELGNYLKLGFVQLKDLVLGPTGSR